MFYDMLPHPKSVEPNNKMGRESPPTGRLHCSRVLGSREVNKPINKIGKVVGTMKKIEEGDFNREWAIAEEIVLVWDIREILHEEEP